MPVGRSGQSLYGRARFDVDISRALAAHGELLRSVSPVQVTAARAPAACNSTTAGSRSPRSKVRTARGASAAQKAKIQPIDAAALEVRALLEETMQLCRR